MNRSVYVTAAIPFVNAHPHIGFATELVLADTVARYHRQHGLEVRFATGTDENSLKSVRAAHAAGLDVGPFVAHNAARFRALQNPFGLEYDDFLRTSVDPRHPPAVARLWTACLESGDIYRARYQGLYCVGCEQFLRADELHDGHCPEHGVAPEPVEEDNYFFRLSRYQHPIKRAILSGTLNIQPRKFRCEILRFIEQGLQDFSISRSRARRTHIRPLYIPKAHPFGRDPRKMSSFMQGPARIR